MRERFAVIVMDVRVAGLDGYETAKLIRLRAQTEFIPIIFLTAFGRDELETATAYASGAVDFVFTPILAGVLRAKFSTFLKLVSRSQELERSLGAITALNAALAGLAGEAIPIAGRIVAVADVYDALTHARPYKPAWSPADAATELTRQSGRSFDPQVVEAFFTGQAEAGGALARV